MIEVTLNELSMQTPAPDSQQARQRMSQLIRVIVQVRRLGFRGPVRTVRGLTARALAPKYLLAQWLNDGGVDAESRTLFKTLATKLPHVEELIAEAETTDNAAYQFTVGGNPALGLGLAHLRDRPAVSLSGDARFDEDPVPVDFVSVSPEGDLDERVQVCCLTRVDQIGPRERWLEVRVRDAVTDGSQLWMARADLFPHLEFCESTAVQLRSLSGTEPYFPQLVRHLRVLDEYMGSWAAGPFALAGISWSDESNATMQHPVYGDLRRINCLGETREFRLHTKPTGGNVRVHFLPYRTDSARAFIGYVGPHLPTVSFGGH